jgi:hypothetical protein
MTQDIESLPKARAEAKAAGASHYFTGKPCSNGHVEKRATSGGACLGCMRDRQRLRLASDPEYRELHRKSCLKHKLKVLSDPSKRQQINARAKELWSERPERRANKAKADRDRNQREQAKARRRELQKNRYREKLASDPAHIAKRKERSRIWAKENPERCNAKTALRRANRKKACPPCLTASDHQEIQAFYNAARRLSKSTGIPHEVDHIIPLLHPLVCGLHVPWNLQVLTEVQNRAKANKLEGE